MGEVRVRMAVVPGMRDSAAVQNMLQYFETNLNTASTDTLQVSLLHTLCVFSFACRSPTCRGCHNQKIYVRSAML